MSFAQRLQQIADADHARQPTCSHCGNGGTPYTHNGVNHDGLIADRGERLCRWCSDRQTDAEGVNILVVDGRPSVPPYVVNTVRDRDVAHIYMPPELRGVDGRDAHKRRVRA